MQTGIKVACGGGRSTDTLNGSSSETICCTKASAFDHVRQSLENGEEGGFVEMSPTWSFVYNILDTCWSILGIVGLRSSHRQAREEHSIPRHQMLRLGKRKIEMECPRHKLEHQTRSVGNHVNIKAAIKLYEHEKVRLEQILEGLQGQDWLKATRKYNGWLYVVKQRTRLQTSVLSGAKCLLGVKMICTKTRPPSLLASPKQIN